MALIRIAIAPTISMPGTSTVKHRQLVRHICLTTGPCQTGGPIRWLYKIAATGPAYSSYNCSVFSLSIHLYKYITLKKYDFTFDIKDN